MYTNTHVSLEINTDNIRVAVSRRNRIIKFGSKSFEKGLVKEGVVVDEHALGIVINSVFDSLKLPRNHVICTISGLPFLYRTITLPSSISDKNTVAEALTRAARKEMQVDEDDFAITWQKTESRIDENDFFVIAVRRNSILALEKTLEIANVKPEVLDLKPLCLARLVGRNDMLVTCIERDYFEILIVKDGLARTIHSFSPHPKMKEKDDLANEFTDGLQRALRSYNTDFPNQPLAPEISLFVGGELSADNELVQLIHKNTNYEINIIQPRLKNLTEAPPSLYANCFGALVNKHPKILLRDEDSLYHNISIDVLEAVREKGTVSKWSAYAAMAVGCVVMIAATYYAYSVYSEEKTKADELDTQTVSLNQELSGNRQIYEAAQKEEAERNARIKTLQSQIQDLYEAYRVIVAQQNDFSSQLVFIESSLPAGIGLKSLKMDGEIISIDGSTKMPFGILDFTEALETNVKYPEAMIMTILPNNLSENSTDDGVHFNIRILNPDKALSN